MAQNKRTIKKKNPTPIGVAYDEQDGDFRLFKIWNKKTTAKEPFYISDNLEDFIEEIEACCKKWNCKVDLKDLKKFINKYKNDQDEETDFPKSYFSQ